MPQLTKVSKVRLRLDIYDPSTHQYRPLTGQSVIIPLETSRLHRPLWRALLAWLRTEVWHDEVKPEEMVVRSNSPYSETERLRRMAERKKK